MAPRTVPPPAVKYNSINEVYRDIHKNRGVDHHTIYRLTVTGNTELLLELTCLLLERYPDLKPGKIPQLVDLKPSSENTGDEIQAPSHGFQHSELNLINYLGLNQGYITQSFDYPPLFYALCCAHHPDVVDFFRILRSRTDWTPATFRQAWFDSEFRAYKQWFVTTMTHISPSQYQFYFTAKLHELMFRPVQRDGKLYYADCLVAWVQPQINLPQDPNGALTWATEIFGPFDAKTIQDYVTGYYQSVIDACIASGNWVSFSLFLSHYHFPDMSIPPKDRSSAPRCVTRSGQIYQEAPLIATLDQFFKSNPQDYFSGQLTHPLSTVLPPSLYGSGLDLPKNIRECILSARPVAFYGQLLDLKSLIRFTESLISTAHSESDLKIITLLDIREDKIKELGEIENNVAGQLTSTTAARAKEIIALLADLQTKRYKLATGGANVESKEYKQIEKDILRLQLEFQSLQDITDLLNADYKGLIKEINLLAEAMSTIRMETEQRVRSYMSLIQSYELQLKAFWSFFVSFVTLFGFDFSSPQEIFTLQAIACGSHDTILLQLLIDFKIPFANEHTLTFDAIPQFYAQLDQVQLHNNKLKSQYNAAVEEKLSNDPEADIEQVEAEFQKQFLMQLQQPPPNLVDFTWVVWDFNHREHRKGLFRSEAYLQGFSNAVKTFSVEQNVDFLTWQLLGCNATKLIEDLMKYLQKSKVIIPKPPVAPKSPKQAAAAGESGSKLKDGSAGSGTGAGAGGGGKGTKGTSKKKKAAAPVSPDEMMAKMFGGASPKNKSPFPDSGPGDGDDDDDLFGAGTGAGPVKVKAIGTRSDVGSPTEPVLGADGLPLKVRKILNINDLSQDLNYVSYVCGTYTCRPSTLRWLLQKKARVSSNSKGGKDKNNAFLICLLSSFSSPQTQDEMLMLLFDYCANPAAFVAANGFLTPEQKQANAEFYENKALAAKTKEENAKLKDETSTVSTETPKDADNETTTGEKESQEGGSKFNPYLTQQEYLNVLSQLWQKMHTPTGTEHLLGPSLLSHKFYNQHNIFYQDRSELILHAKRLVKAQSGSDPGAQMNKMAAMMMGGMPGMGSPPGMPPMGANPLDGKQWLSTLVDTFRFEFSYSQHDISIFNQQNESTYYHHKRHVVFSEQLRSQTVQQRSSSPPLTEFQSYYNQLVSIPSNVIDAFDYASYPSCLKNLDKNPDNGYYGYFGFCDHLDPSQRSVLSGARSNAHGDDDAFVDGAQLAKDQVYMRTDLSADSYFHGFYKDVCLFYTHIFFGDAEHRALIGNVSNYEKMSQLVQYAIAVRCYPVLQFLTNHGYIPGVLDISFCFYTNTNSFWLNEVNFEDYYTENVKREAFVKGFQKVVEFKQQFPDGQDIDQDPELEQDQVVDMLMENDGQDGENVTTTTTTASGVDDIDGVDSSSLPEPTQPEEFDPFSQLGDEFDPFAMLGDDQERNNHNDAQNDLESQPQSLSNLTLDANVDEAADESDNDNHNDNDTIKIKSPKNNANDKDAAAHNDSKTKPAKPAKSAPTITTVDLPRILAQLPSDESQFRAILQPFCLAPGMPFRRFVINSEDPIFSTPYPDPVSRQTGFRLTYGDRQHLALGAFQIDCDYHFQQNHNSSSRDLFQFISKLTFEEALRKYPSIIAQLKDICGTALHLGVPGALEYDIKYLFRNPDNKTQTADRPSRRDQNKPDGARVEEYDPKADYNNTFLLEAFRLIRAHQSWFHDAKSPNFSPLIQCLLTLTNAVPKLGPTLEDAIPLATWNTGSAFMGYLFTLTRSDPFLAKEFASPVGSSSALWFRYTTPCLTRNFQKLAGLVKDYTAPGTERLEVISSILEEGIQLQTERFMDIVKAQSDLMEEQQQAAQMAAKGGMAAMQQQMMMGAQMQQAMKMIQRRMAECTIDSPAFFTTFLNCLDDNTHRDGSTIKSTFPQAIFKNFLLNPAIMKSCQHKFVLFDILANFRTANGNTPFKKLTTTQIPCLASNPDYSQNQPRVLDALNQLPVDEHAKPTVSTPTIVPLAHAIQPLHYIAAIIHQTLLQLIEVESIEGQLGAMFEARAQKVKSQREMEALQGEFQQAAQEIMMRKQEVQNTLYSQAEIDTLVSLVQHGLENNDVYELMVQMGMKETGEAQPVDENGNPIDPNQPPSSKRNSKKKKQGPDESEQAELLLKTVMEARSAPKTAGGWLSAILKTTLAATGVAAVASAAYVAYQYWNGAWGSPSDGMVEKDTKKNSVHDELLSSSDQPDQPRSQHKASLEAFSKPEPISAAAVVSPATPSASAPAPTPAATAPVKTKPVKIQF